MDEFLDSFIAALKEFSDNNQLNRPFIIYLVTNCDDFDQINNIFTTIASRYSNQQAVVPNPAATPAPQSHHPSDPKEEEEENCVICMDKKENEKKLDKCGHSFCKDCIERYFKTKYRNSYDI